MKTSASRLLVSRPGGLAGLGIAAALTLALPGTASSADVISDWASAVSGAWNVNANWINTPAMGGFPNNGNGGVPTYDALIDVTGAAYTVTLGTDITVEDLSLNSANATVNHTSGTFTATGAITISAGIYRLSGGTISNTDINPAGGNFVFTTSGGNLSNGAVFNGDLNLAVDNTSVQLLSGASFTGVANVSGGNALLAIQDTQTLTGKTINLEGGGARLSIEGVNTLTLGAGTLVRGRGDVAGQFISGGNSALLNQAGTIRADLAGQALTISGESFSNQAAGVTEAINGGTLSINAANWSNAGQLNATGGSTVNFNGTWSNAGGTATVDGTSTLNLNGASTIASLGTINNSAGGTVNIGGTITNTGTTLAFNATTGSWRLLGGTISGGQITPGAGGQTLLFTTSGGNLSNGAVFNGDLNLAVDNTSVQLLSGASFTGVANVTGTNALLAIQDTQTLTGKTINLEGGGARLSIEGVNTLTLGAGTLVRGRGDVAGQFISGGNSALLNQAGTIRADLAGQALTISGESFSNQAAGVTEAINGGTLSINAANWSNAGQLNATGGSTVNFNGTWSNAGGTATVDGTSTLNLNGASTIASLGTINNSAGGTVNIGGTITNTGTTLAFNATTGSWRLLGGTISGGQITPGAGGQTLLFTTSGGNLSNGAVFNGDLNLAVDNTSVQLLSGASFTGVANVTGTNALLAIQDTQTLTGKSINLEGGGARLSIEGVNTLTLGAGTLVRGRGDVAGQFISGGNSALLNQAGTIRADLAGQALTISGESFSNQAAGVTEAINGGTLSINAANWSNAGQLNATGGSTVNFNGTWSNAGGTATVDGTSTLNLNGASTIASLGTINNSAGGTVNIGGTITNTGTTLAFNATTGSWRLLGGTISGGQITPGAGGQTLLFTTSGGNLSNGAVFNGDLNLAVDNTSVQLLSGASFTGVANVTGTNALLAIQDTQTLTGKSINLEGGGARLSIEGVNTLTLGAGTLVRGRGDVAGQFISGGNSALLNQAGTIRADLAGQALTISGESFSNQAAGVTEAINGGTLSINAANVTEYTGTSLTGGIWRVFADSILNLPATGTGVVTNQGDITLSGAGSVFRAASATLDSRLTTNAGALRLLAGRDYTASSALTNSGVLQLDAVTFNAPGLTNTATGELFGFGTVAVRPTSSGRVRAAGGTLTLSNGLQDGTGTVQIDAGAVLDVSGGASGSGADLLIHNGTTAGSLNLGANNFTVDVDYTNASFGVGNSFNPRANVSGAGLIMASGGIAQQLTGNVTGGTGATPTLAFGNVHVGDAPTRVYQINNVGAGGPSLRGAIQTSVNGGNVTDARLSGPGVTVANFGPIAPGANSGDRAVTFTATSAGALTGQAVSLLNNFDNVGEQTLSITGAAFRFAGPTAHTPEPIAFGNRHVGDPAPSQALSITNNVPNDGFSESLDGSLGSPTGGVTASGSFSALAPGATNGASLLVGINTSSAGSKNGTATIALTSNGAGSSALGLTPLTPQTVNVTGAVFRFANPSAHTPEPVSLGNRHVGDPAPSQALSLTNNVPADGFSEALNASIGGATGAVSASGSISLLAPGATNNSSLLISTNTTTVGTKNGTAVITLVSDGTGSSGLGQTVLASQTVNVTSSVFRLASASAHTPEPVVFANRHVGDAAQQAIAMTNTAANDGFSEELDAEFGAPLGNATASGSFGQLAPQATNNTSLIVGIDTSTAGAKSGSVPLNLASNGSGTSDLPRTVLPSQIVNVSGNVYRLASATAHTPEPVDVGVVHVGEPAQRTLMIENAAANDGFSEKLSGSISGMTGQASGSGSFIRLNPGATDSTSLLVGINTGSAGTKSGSVTIGLTSDGLGTSDLPATALTNQIVNVQGQVNNFASVIYLFQSGSGSLTQNSATSFTLDFGVIEQNTTTPSANLGLNNNAAAPADSLAGTFTFAAPDFALAGFNSFSGINAGQTQGGISVGLATGNVGDFNGQITLAGRSRNVSGFDGSLGSYLLNVHGQVIPEPSTALLATIGGAGVLLIGRWRRRS